MTKRLCKVPEVAETLNVSDKLIWKMIASGQLEVVRIGRSVRIKMETVDCLMEHGTTPARPGRRDVGGDKRVAYRRPERTPSRKIKPRGNSDGIHLQ